MIRVNLLGAAGPKAPGPAPTLGPAAPPSAKTGYLLAILILGGTLGFAAFQWWSASQQIAKLDQDIKFFTEEKARLQAIIAQVNEYEQKIRRLEEKKALIERLKRERSGPVHVLDQLSAQLPDFIWLTQISEVPGSITIDGMAASYVSIADYIRKLEDTAFFDNVELVDARQEKEFTKFQLRSQLVTPSEPAVAGQPAGAPLSPAGGAAPATTPSSGSR
jgi:type IV pilus assembly protein PilN